MRPWKLWPELTLRGGQQAESRCSVEAGQLQIRLQDGYRRQREEAAVSYLYQGDEKNYYDYSDDDYSVFGNLYCQIVGQHHQHNGILVL